MIVRGIHCVDEISLINALGRFVLRYARGTEYGAARQREPYHGDGDGGGHRPPLHVLGREDQSLLTSAPTKTVVAETL
jgi:hypothetical protein